MNILEIAQPYLTAIVTAIIGLLASVLLAGIGGLRIKVEAWLEARTTAAQREVLHKLAAEAYAYVEQQYREKDGDTKLKEATAYVLQRWKLDMLGIDYDGIQAAIQKAWQELDTKNRGAAQ